MRFLWQANARLYNADSLNAIPYLNFIPVLRTSGLKKRIFLGNKIKVKIKDLEFDNIYLYLHS